MASLPHTNRRVPGSALSRNEPVIGVVVGTTHRHASLRFSMHCLRLHVRTPCTLGRKTGLPNLWRRNEPRGLTAFGHTSVRRAASFCTASRGSRGPLEQLFGRRTLEKIAARVLFIERSNQHESPMVPARRSRNRKSGSSGQKQAHGSFTEAPKTWPLSFRREFEAFRREFEGFLFGQIAFRHDF